MLNSREQVLYITVTVFLTESWVSVLVKKLSAECILKVCDEFEPENNYFIF